jgi:hypothetical protein
MVGDMMKVRVNFKDTESTIDQEVIDREDALRWIKIISTVGIYSQDKNGFSYYPPHTIKRIDFYKD